MMNSFEWRLVQTSGESPGLLDEHSAVVSGWNMIIFGGYSSKGRKNDVYFYNVDEKTWIRKLGGSDPKKTPIPRSGHSSVVLGDLMWMFGG